MAASTTKTILDAVNSILQGGIGVGSGATYTIALANFYVRKLPWDDGVAHPGVFIVPVPEIEKPATNASDDVGFGVQITIAQTGNRYTEAYADQLYYWRETAMGLFRSRRLAGVSDVHNCTIEPRPVIDPAAFAALVDATAFVVRAWVRVARP